MSKYIDADRLNAEITGLCANANFYQQKAIEESNREDFISSGGEIFAYAKVLAIISSLQQDLPEVDLEKEIEKYCRIYYNCNYPDQIQNGRCSPVMPHIVEAARHFYRLGLKARKALPERFNLQPKQNDMITPNKEFFQWIYDRLVNVHNEDPNVDYMISFKERIEELSFNEPSWKPSKEQVEAIKHAYNSFPNDCPTKSNLKLLYFDLKKLI